MKIRDVLDYVIELQEPAFSETVLLRWLNQVEAEIQTEVLLLAVDGIVQYSAEDLKAESNTELIVPAPFSKLYEDYLLWRIALGQGEAERANNLETIYHNSYLAYVRFVCGTIDPGSGNAEQMRYYLTAYQIAVKLGFTGSEEEWIASLKGDDGEIGAGLEITDQVLTEEELPALTSSMSDIGKAYLVGEGTGALLYIWNGTEWFYKQTLSIQGPPGESGADGVSPTITVTEIEGGHRLTIADKAGTKSVDVMDGEVGQTGATGQTGQTGATGEPGKDGVSPTITTAPITGGHRLTIKDADGTKSIDLLNGSDGKDGSDGSNGKDGVSPVLNVTAISGGSRITITDAAGTKSIDLLNGSDGKDGSTGADGKNGVSPVLGVSAIDGGHRISITDAEGTKTVDVMDGQDGSPGAAGKDGSDGSDGRGVQKIERTAGTGAAGSADTYTITYTDNTTSKFTVYNGADGTSFVVKDRYDTLDALKTAHSTGSEGEAYAVGTESENIIYIWGVDTSNWTPIGSLQGPQGIPGEDGRAAEFRASGGYLQWRLVGDTDWANLVPLSEITGPAGSDGSAGAAGKDGVSPTVTVQEITGGHRLTITDANSTKNVDIMDGADGKTGADGSPGAAGEDGFSPTVSVSSISGGHRVYITDASGTKTFDVLDGSDGATGADGSPGATGQDGVSPTVAVSTITGGHRITVTDADGSRSFDVMDGSNGQDGSPGAAGSDGKDGTSVTVTNVSESDADGGMNVVTFSDGKTLNVKNGSKGGDGAPGERGVTFTPSVDADGNLSWSNDGGLENPATVNIRGPGSSFDEDQIDDIIFITVEDIDAICNPQPDEPDEPDEPDIPANTFQKVRAFQDGKEYILLFGYNGGYYCLSNEAFNDWTVKAAAVPEVTSTNAQITFTTVPVLFTARASGSGFTLHNGSNNVYAYAQSNGTGLRVNTETAAVFTVDTSATGGFDSDEYIAKVDSDAVWLRASFEAGNACLKFESANTSIGIDYKDRDATYSTAFLSFVLYEKIS